MLLPPPLLAMGSSWVLSRVRKGETCRRPKEMEMRTAAPFLRLSFQPANRAAKAGLEGERAAREEEEDLTAGKEGLSPTYFRAGIRGGGKRGRHLFCSRRRQRRFRLSTDPTKTKRNAGARHSLIKVFFTHSL